MPRTVHEWGWGLWSRPSGGTKSPGLPHRCEGQHAGSHPELRRRAQRRVPGLRVA